MSRGLSASNQTEITATHLEEVVLLKLEYDTPVYLHFGMGTITFDSNAYLGIGDFGNTGGSRESENLGPMTMTYTFSALDSTLLAEALDSGRYGDVITEYIGYRQDDRTLVADPWISNKGKYDHAAVTIGNDNTITVFAQHDLAVLDEIAGRKFSDEDQRTEYSADVGLEHVVDAEFVKLVWGGGPVVVTGNGTNRDQRFLLN